MRTRRLGNSPLELSVIGLGTWAIGGPWKYGWGAQNDADSIAAIQRAIDLGINWIDTAHVYGFGHSESIVGQAIQGRRDRVLVATKCGLLPDGEGGARACLEPKSVREELEGSLKRLGVDVIDLYQIHWPNPEEDIERAWEVLAKAKDEGLVRAIGVSNFTVEQMKRVQKIAPIDSLQPPYSMLRPAIEQMILPFCRENRIGVVAYSPMLSGMLTGKVTPEYAEALDPTDWRRNNKEWQGARLLANIELVETVLRPIAQAHGVTPGCVAVAWVLREEVVTSAIVGGRNAEQVEEFAQAGALELSAEELERLAAGAAANLAVT